jgi:hypothetical protein
MRAAIHQPGATAILLSFVRSQAESTFKENPYFVVDQSWVKNDAAVSSVANGEDDWFGVPTPTDTNQAFGGHAFGATVPSFQFVTSTTDRVIDPNHGNTFVIDLQNTVGQNDFLTLVEGFSDWPENAAMWRTENAPYSTTQRDYPSQDINAHCGAATYPARWPSQSWGWRKRARSASGVPNSGWLANSQRAIGGRDIRIASMLPRVCRPNKVPLSWTRLNST